MWQMWSQLWNFKKTSRHKKSQWSHSRPRLPWSFTPIPCWTPQDATARRSSKQPNLFGDLVWSLGYGIWTGESESQLPFSLQSDHFWLIWTWIEFLFIWVLQLRRVSKNARAWDNEKWARNHALPAIIWIIYILIFMFAARSIFRCDVPTYLPTYLPTYIVRT